MQGSDMNYFPLPVYRQRRTPFILMLSAIFLPASLPTPAPGAEESLFQKDSAELVELVADFPDVTQALRAELALRALDRGEPDQALKLSADLEGSLGLEGARIHAEALYMAGRAEEADDHLRAASNRYQPAWPQALLLFRLHHGQGDVLSLISAMAQNSAGVAQNPYQRKQAALVQLLADDYDQAVELLSTNAPGVRQNYHQSSAFLAALEAHQHNDLERRDQLLDAYRKRLQSSLADSTNWSEQGFQRAMLAFADAAREAWDAGKPVLPPGPPLRQAIANDMPDYLQAIVNFYAGRAYQIAGPEWYPRAQRAYERAVAIAPKHRNTRWESALAAHYLRHLLLNLAESDADQTHESTQEGQP